DGGTAWGTGSSGYSIDQGVTDVDEATLRAVHLPPYQATIEAGARSLMVSYSSWGGLKMHAQEYLLTEVLRGEMGFEGFIVSDWAGIDQISPNYYQAVVAAINAGVDMNMVPYDAEMFINTMLEAVEKGDISLERIDQAVTNILTVKFELGLFENPFSNPELLAAVGSEAHRALAREAVSKSLVLLKNEGQLLPLPKEINTLYVAGTGADDIGMQSGGWTIEWQGKLGDITPGTTILEAINNTVSPDTTVVYDKNGQFGAEITPGVCLAVIGERPYAEGRGDSSTLRLDTTDLRLVQRMEEQCDQLVVILLSGRPVIVSEQIENWDALVAAWLPGTEGQGVVDVLFGDQPFTGRLSFTWPRTVEQLPFDFDNIEAANPLFPFGYGISEP
ncbi:MAG: glycoside hydrolase family 3 C-terminal domain-containing protein, partial [Anaerolineales bacterium]|nr:glycoside hydrolase family 3 C-terminal domain-containing protein [Anaerolineales bacterium]